MFLVQNAPILCRPTINGQFAVKSDACIFAWGGILYQLQKDEKFNWIWCIIDMWSQIMPKNLRNNHCKLHEGYAFMDVPVCI